MSLYRILVSAFLVLLLGACSGGGNQQRPVLPDFPDGSGNILPNQRGVIFTYPAREQAEVAPRAPIALRFSHPLELGGLDGDAGAAVAASFFRLVDVSTGERIPFTLTLIPQPADPADEDPDKRPRGVLIQPVDILKPNTRYRIQSNNVGSNDPAHKGIPLATGDENQSLVTMPGSGANQFVFTTRAAIAGAIASQSADAEFKVMRLLPNTETALIGEFPTLDFSTLRLQFSQPIDPETAVYAANGTVKLVDQATGVLIPARFLISGNRMVIDPLSDLSPAKTYVLNLTSGLQSRFGNALAADFTHEFVPRDTRPPEAGAPLTRNRISIPSESVLSLLTGMEANRVPVASEILGRGAEAPDPAAQGDLFVDLAHSPNFGDIGPAIIPIRVPANSELTAATLVVKLGGKTLGVPANLETGTLSIKLVSDGNGLLLPNRYNNSLNAPGLVNLVMDVAMSAEVPTANGAFTQDILHVEVNGIATLDQQGQLLKIEAVGVVELKILGVDDAIGILSLKLQSGDLRDDPGAQAPDTSRPFVQSWAPGGEVTLNKDLQNALTFDGGELIRPGDPLIVNFSKIMESATLRNPAAVTLFKGSMAGAESEPVPIRTNLDGASLVINADLEHGSFYRIKLDPEVITDLSGNKLQLSPAQALIDDGLAVSAANDLLFSLPALAATPDTQRPPVALSVYPGYPCPIAEGTRNVAANLQGRCRGGQSGDDLLPLPKIELSRDIRVAFSQSIARLSVKQATECNGAGSLRVERVDASGNCLGVVQGQINIKPRELSFTPATPWVRDQLYRYVLGSNGSMTSSAADCLGNQAICGENGLPLQTQLIAQSYDEVSEPKRGGPSMEIFFRGGDDLPGASVGLRVLPVTDVDANFLFEPAKGERLARLANGNLCQTGMMPNPDYPTTDSRRMISDPNNPPTTGRCFTANGALLQVDSAHPDGPFSGAATQFGLGCKSGEWAEDDPGRPNPASGGDGEECQGNQFLLITASLGAKLGNLVSHPTSGNQVVEVVIDPSIVITSGADIFAELGVALDAVPILAPGAQLLCGIPFLGPLVCDTLLQPGMDALNGLLPISVPQPLATGPLVFRLRHPCDNGADTCAPNQRNSPIRGYIVEGANGPELEATLELYTDIPELEAIVELLGQPAIPINHDVRSNIDLSRYVHPTDGVIRTKVTGKVNFLPDGRLTVALANEQPVRLTANLSALGGLLGGVLRVYVAPQRFIIDASLAPIKQ